MGKPLRKRLFEKWQEILSIHRWVAFVLPMGLFLIIGSLEPRPPEVMSSVVDGISTETAVSTAWYSIPYRYYPWIYSFKLLATLFALRFVWPVYKPLRRPIGWKGIALGTVGAFVWIGLCNLQWEQSTLQPLLKSVGLDSLLGTGSRSAFNPFAELKGDTFGILFYLVVRGIGLILVVPIIEEHFLRGFVIRYVAADKWWKYPIGQVTLFAAVVGTVLPMLMHPGELLAAAVWFSLMTALAWHTKNLWECIAAHCTTNLLLGIYVVTYAAWHLV